MVFPSTGMDTPKRRKRLKMSIGDSGVQDAKKTLPNRKDKSSRSHSTPTTDCGSDKDYDGGSPLRTPMRSVGRPIDRDNEDSPGIELSYLKTDSTPTVVWDFARPKQSQSIMEAASRIHKELKEHQAKRRQHKSPTYCRDRPLLAPENEEETVIKAVEHYRNSFTNLNQEILAIMEDSDSSEDEKSVRRNYKKRRFSSSSRGKMRSSSKGECSTSARRTLERPKSDKTTSVTSRKKEPIVMNNNNSDLKDLFNDSFDDIMLSQSQIIESKLSKSCEMALEKKAVSNESQVVDELNDGNDDLFSSISFDF